LEGGELAAEGYLCFDFPRQITPSNASNAPANIPGKKPAATAAPGKRGHCAVAGGLFESMPVPLLATAVAEVVGRTEDAVDTLLVADDAVVVDVELVLAIK
jgi:hypothetical protein